MLATVFLWGLGEQPRVRVALWWGVGISYGKGAPGVEGNFRARGDIGQDSYLIWQKRVKINISNINSD